MLRSHAINGNEFQTPGHRWFPAKHWDAWFLNSSKSKTRLKFMKLGMLSWSGINMLWYKFCPIWGSLGYMLLANRSFSQQAWWFSVGNVPPLRTKRYPLPLIALNFFLVSTSNNRSVVWIFVIFRGSFGHFYALTEFSMHFMCIIQIWTTCTCSSAYKLVEKSNLCPWVHA